VNSFGAETQNQRMRYCVLCLLPYIYCFIFATWLTGKGSLVFTPHSDLSQVGQFCFLACLPTAVILSVLY